MSKNLVLTKAVAAYHNLPKYIIRNIYRKPRLILGLLVHPSQIFEESYFLEYPRKSKLKIFCEQLRNIIRYGSIDEYYYMYGLDVQRETQSTEYIIYSKFKEIRDSLNLSNPHNDSTVLRNKLFFESIAQSLGLRTPENICYITDEKIIPLHKSGIKDWTEFPEGVYFAKPIDGECGGGIVKFRVEQNKIYVKNQYISSEDLRSILGRGNYIVQKQLVQHPEMSKLYPNSVNTIRMTTIRNNKTGEIEVLPPTLRIGAHGSVVDNFSKGGVIVAMDTLSGKPAEWGFYKPMYGFKSTEHPDTKIKFSDFVVPYYNEAKEQAIFFHSFLNLHSIGWDIAISEDGPVFIEGNDNWEINLPQTFENPMKEEFKRLFCH